MSMKLKGLIAKEYETKFKGADSVVIINYSGVASKDANDIRTALRKKKVKMTVVRNAMAIKALAAVGFAGADKLITGTNAIVYGGDSVVDIMKELLEQAKKFNNLKIKGAIMDGQILEGKAAEALSKLPNKKELQAMIVAQIVGPARKIAGQVVAPARKLAGQVKAVAEKQEKAGAAA